jgi:hypothetical protein
MGDEAYGIPRSGTGEGVDRADRVRRVGRGGREMKRTESREAGQEKRSISQWVDRSRG